MIQTEAHSKQTEYFFSHLKRFRNLELRKITRKMKDFLDKLKFERLRK